MQQKALIVSADIVLYVLFVLYVVNILNILIFSFSSKKHTLHEYQNKYMVNKL